MEVRDREEEQVAAGGEEEPAEGDPLEEAEDVAVEGQDRSEQFRSLK